MSTPYSISVLNTGSTSMDGATFALYAQLPEAANGNALSLAWQSQPLHHGVTGQFNWEMDWGFAWSETEAVSQDPPASWKMSESETGDPTQAELAEVDLNYDSGGFSFTRSSSGATGVLTVVDDIPATAPAVSVAATLNGEPACVMAGGPSSKQIFTPGPTYYINAGTYVAGDMVSGADVSTFYEIQFPQGVTNVNITLNPDNTWSGGGSGTQANVAGR